jgi:tol-pal system protein YbgF
MKSITFVALVGALAVSVPAQAQNREHLQMAAELQILRTQNQELANALLQVTQLLNETAKALNARIDQQSEAMRKGFADQSITINATAGDVRKTLAQTQDAATRLGELKEEVEALRSSIPSLLSRLSSADVAPADAGAAPVAGAAAPPDSAPAPSTLGLSPERMFNTANSDYAAGNYQSAIQGFQDLLKTYPTTLRAAAAQQTIGDAEFQQNRFEQAIAAYNLVIQNYPKSDQVPWAYYKRGQAQTRLGQTAPARASFETVVKQFPDSEPAVLSGSRLQAIDNAPPPATRKP